MAKTAGAQFVEDNFTQSQRNQLALLGVLNDEGELNVHPDTKPNVTLRTVAETEVGADKKFAVLGHVYIDGANQRFTANIRKMPDGTVTASTRATFDGGWRETTPQFTVKETREAWGQFIRKLGEYCEVVGLV
jgi:hypothetical protein